MRPALQHAVCERRGDEIVDGRFRRVTRRAAVLLTTAVLPAAALVLPTAAPAASAPNTATFTAGADQPFTVPAGVTQLSVTATGAKGQDGPFSGGAGGSGSTVSGTINVTPGSTLYVNVDTGGGSGGGGVGGGTGGGSSDVRTCSSADAGCVLTGVPSTDPRLVVAGGGGGGGGGFPGLSVPQPTGGDAGDIGGTGGSRPSGGGGGHGGTQTAGGAGGAACSTGGATGTAGQAGAGGMGGFGFSGGGGGGGWFGGGGGGGCNGLGVGDGTLGPGGGGGGSNFAPSGGTSGPASGPAQVTISFPALTITKTHSGSFTRGRTGTYTLTVRNGGTAPTNGSTVTVTDILPPGLTAASIGGTGWTCLLATLTCTRSNTLSPGNSYPAITLTVTVTCKAAKQVTNAVMVTGGNSTPSNGTDSTTIKSGYHCQKPHHHDGWHDKK